MSILVQPRFFCLGFRRWKAVNLKPLISLHPERVFFLNSISALKKYQPHSKDIFIVWGNRSLAEFESLASEVGARFLRIEDGFVRSVGLGSDLIRPTSIVFDEKGLYFDPSKPSDLEEMLNHSAFSAEDLDRAKKIREYIVEHHVTKYNIESHRPLEVANEGRKILLVIGQVEDDASILIGAGEVKTNLDLLEAVRAGNPHAFIIYKPHPDVVSGNRKGSISNTNTILFADHIEREHSVLDCIDACDEVHTITSLTGFDALLRDKKVVTYGQPFYAGWGLTDDVYSSGEAFKRRIRKLNIDQLVAGALIYYPVYWDWDLKGYTTCEAALLHLVKERDALIAKGALEKLRVGFVRRQIRKLRILISSYIAREI